MNNSRATIFLFVGAIIAGIAAAYLANSFINNKIKEHKANLDKQYESVGVVVPNQNLRKGAILSKGMLSVRNVPRAFIHKDTVMPATVDDVVSHQVVFPVNRGEPLLFSHVSKARGKGFSSLIEEGKRALTFPVDIINSVSGMLRPNDRIDLLMTLSDDNVEKTLPLLTDVTVMATGAQVDEEFQNNQMSARYQTITLLVSAEDAARIIHANKAADLSVTLRSPNDQQLGFQTEMTNDILLGKTKRKRTVNRKPRLQVIKGGDIQ